MKWFGKCKWWVVCGLALGLALVLAALAFPQQVLCVESGPVQGDVIVVLGGGGGERAKRAAELFQAGAAPRVLISGEGDAESNRRLLIRLGVSAAAIEVEPNSRNTQQNAVFSGPLLRGGRDASDGTGAANLRQDAAITGKQDAYLHKRVILVTSWYHSRRALQCFRHYVPGIQFYSRPSYYAYARADWTREGIRPYIRAEYLKLVGYWVRYGVWPV